MRRKEEQEDQLEALNPGYWEEDFDAADAELAALPAHFDEAVLEAELESRTWSLEVWSSPPLKAGGAVRQPRRRIGLRRGCDASVVSSLTA